MLGRLGIEKYQVLGEVKVEQRIGFIGLGNMGSAILQGVLASNKVAAEQFYIFDIHPEKGEALAQRFGVHAMASAKEVAHEVDIVFLAIKPYLIQDVLSDIQKELKKTTVVVSIAAGVTIKTIENVIGYEQKVVRVMPNTPALVNAAMCSITPNTEVTEAELASIKAILDCIGLTAIVPEEQIHAVTGVSGSGPAYVFMLIEAMADAGVRAGMPRKSAYQFAAQTVLGSAKMVLDTEKHPGYLKDMVCSPAGTTIEAVRVLEAGAFRGTIIDAIAACVAKSEQMSKK